MIGKVLDEAKALINGARRESYGSPQESLNRVAAFWRNYLSVIDNGEYAPKVNITGADVALMMVLFKVARESNEHSRDNIVDIAGYAGLAGEFEDE